MLEIEAKIKRKPAWLKIKKPLGANYGEVKSLLQALNLHTVCQEANCPNRADCFGAKTATFLILGDLCTRGCSFCNVRRGRPEPQIDRDEPRRLTLAALRLGLKYIVITSVTRDDLPDGGASAFVETIRTLRNGIPSCRIEVLIPDFGGNAEALELVLQAWPDVLNHNLETVERLYPRVRKGADYDRSLTLLARAKRYGAGLMVKTGLMVGLGETADELKQAMHDLVNQGCDLLTVGQYLAPSNNHFPVARFYTPEEFEKLSELALQIGFKGVVSGPLIRSSYQASQMFSRILQGSA